MASPNYSPAGGIGSQAIVDNTIYKFTNSGWSPVGTSAANYSGGGSAGYNVTKGSPSGQVKGATTTTPSSSPAPSNTKDPNANPGSGYFWDAADGWKPVGGGDNTAGPSQQEIDAAFSPLFGALDSAESGIRSGYNEDVQGVDKRYGTYNQQYEDERGRLVGEAEDKQADFKDTLKSALSDAIKAYNALQQQRISRFGGGSSAGEAVGELARQEYFKQQGEVNKEGVRGEKEFAKEFANIGTFIAQKKSELDLWKEEALGTLKKNLNSQLANIQMQRGETESAKAQARLSIIQDSINRARSIQDQDRSFRQQLAIAGVNQLQQSSGKTFTPEEIQAYVTQFMGGNTAIGAAPSTGVGASVPAYNPNVGSKDDELSGIQGVV